MISKNNNNYTKYQGNKYELKAIKYFTYLGYTLYGQNIRIGRREVDIIFIDKKNNITILVEVKYRKNFLSFFPQMSKIQKQNLLEIGLMLESFDENLPKLWQIDFIVFSDEKRYHIKNLMV